MDGREPSPEGKRASIQSSRLLLGSALGNEPQAVVGIGPLSCAAPSLHLSDDDIEDWKVMFRAVLVRLIRTAEECDAAMPDGGESVAALRFKSSVLECVDALSSLNATAIHEFKLRQDREATISVTPGGLS